jgi:Resolvase, N terminal domain
MSPGEQSRNDTARRRTRSARHGITANRWVRGDGVKGRSRRLPVRAAQPLRPSHSPQQNDNAVRPTAIWLPISGRGRGGNATRPRLNALMSAARNHEIDCVLVWKFDRFARSTRHLLTALEEFNHLGVRFVSVQDQLDTDSPMGRAMFTIIGAMAELESSLISERVTAGMKAAEARGKHLGRPPTAAHVVSAIMELATSTDLSIWQIQAKIAGRASRTIVGEITKLARFTASAAL